MLRPLLLWYCRSTSKSLFSPMSDVDHTMPWMHGGPGPFFLFIAPQRSMMNAASGTSHLPDRLVCCHAVALPSFYHNHLGSPDELAAKSSQGKQGISPGDISALGKRAGETCFNIISQLALCSKSLPRIFCRVSAEGPTSFPLESGASRGLGAHTNRGGAPSTTRYSFFGRVTA